MIFQALYEYYQRKLDDPDSTMAPVGFEYKEIPYLLEITSDGSLHQIIDTRIDSGKKKRAKAERVPQGVKRTSAVVADLLWGNAEYVLGVDTKGKPERIKAQQAAFVERIRALNLAEQDSGVAAVLSFLEKLDHADLEKHAEWEDIKVINPFVSFRLQGQSGLVCQSKAVQKALSSQESCAEDQSVCLVTGKEETIERLHPAIKGVWGGQSSGGNIVSFNLDAFTSYGKTQSFNAPVGKGAADAYTKALNDLLGKDSQQRMQVGDASTVFWASKEDPLEDDFSAIWGAAASDKKDSAARNTLAVHSLYKSVSDYGRSPALGEETRFYILGLSPNAARISIRFWHVATVREVSGRIVKHFENLSIVRNEAYDQEFLPLWLLMKSVALLGKTENVPPNLAGDTLRSILSGLPYPPTLLSSAIRRIRAEQSKKDSNGKPIANVTYPRAALIKACINTQRNQKEHLSVSLDPENLNAGYRLGRLFAMLENIQEKASGGKLNATIRDRYYGAASSTPIAVFPTLLKLTNHHLKKIDAPKLARYFENRLEEIIDGLDSNRPFPSHMTLEDQGRFAVGYYHQRHHRGKTAEAGATQTEAESGTQGELL